MRLRGGGIFALFYLRLHRRRIMKLPMVYQVLGLCGGLGLIAITLVIMAWALVTE